jgi:hypothetical protein
MLKYLPLAVTLIATVGAAIFTPAFVAAHPTVFIVLNALAQILHAALPSIFGSPTT